ncbi:MAG: SH3 domain-containing protein [Arthrobacter sp.]|jgi:hypothetical protein|nr:SH3 domain-containing protein [Arthrobacter sp.]
MNHPTKALAAAALLGALALSGCTPATIHDAGALSDQAAPASSGAGADVVLDELGEGVYDLAAVKTSTIAKTTIRTTTFLNLRAGASASTKRLATLPKGQQVTSTRRASNGWYKVTYKGKSGWVSDRYVTKVKVTKPAKPSAKPKAANGAKLKAGTNFSYAGLRYAVLDGGVNKSRTQGAMIFLDGDYYPGYKSAISNNPTGAKAKAMAKVAAKRNMYLIIPRLPAAGYKASLGYTWWGVPSKTVPLVKKLDAKVRSTGISKGNTWYMGYSGGAEFISYELARTSQGSYGNGGAILVAGGGVRSNGANIRISTPPAAFKKSFDMHYFVGSKDGTGQSLNAATWSAHRATAQGAALYKSKGFKTTRTVLAGLGHHDYNMSTLMDAGFKKAGK